VKIYCLPKELRVELRKLHGELYKGDGIETARQIIKDLNNPAMIITVGDIVTYNLLNAGLVPNISFVDNKTKRGATTAEVLNGTRHPHFKIITVENPSGTITEELINET